MTTQKDLVGQWSAAGYRKGMASATIVPPPPKGFRRVYQMLSAKWALVAIDDRRLKVSRFDDLNDPFELLGMNRHTPIARKVSKEFRARLNELQGLLCFGADWSNAVMWSHYADRHKGICLGFDVRKTLLQEVRYEDERIRVALGRNADPANLAPELQRQISCTKAKAWAYEEEFRRFIDLRDAISERGLHFMPFDDDMRLAEVILGPTVSRRHHRPAATARAQPSRNCRIWCSNGVSIFPRGFERLHQTTGLASEVRSSHREVGYAVRTGSRTACQVSMVPYFWNIIANFGCRFALARTAASYRVHASTKPRYRPMTLIA